MTDVTIELLDPIQGHGGLVKQIVLREPCFREVLKYGEPTSFGRGGDIVYRIENTDTVRSYILASIIVPDDKTAPRLDEILIERLSLADTLRVKAAVLDFFTRAELRTVKPADTSSPQNTSGS